MYSRYQSKGRLTGSLAIIHTKHAFDTYMFPLAPRGGHPVGKQHAKIRDCAVSVGRKLLHSQVHIVTVWAKIIGNVKITQNHSFQTACMTIFSFCSEPFNN